MEENKVNEKTEFEYAEEKPTYEEAIKEIKKNSKATKQDNKIADLKEKIKALEEELEEQIRVAADATDKYLRYAAEVENFKKRILDERNKERKYASYGLISELIQPLEYLNASVNMQTEDQMLKNFLFGFQMINKQLFDALEKDGLKVIECNVGDEFNPAIHQALEVIYEEDKEDNTILQVMQRGYIYNDRIVRPSMVKVNKKGEN